MRSSITSHIINLRHRFGIEVVIVFVSFLIYTYCGGMGNFLICFNDLLCIAILISYMYSLITRIYAREDNKGIISFSLLNCSMLILLRIIGVLIYILDMRFSFHFLLYTIQNTFAFLQLELIFRFRNISNKIKSIFFLYYLQILSLIFVLGRGFSHSVQRNTYMVYSMINFVLSLLVCFIIINEIRKFKKSVTSTFFKIVVLHMISIMSNYIYFFAIRDGNRCVMVVFVILENVGLYLFYDRIIEIVSKQYMEIATMRTKEINRIIKKRNVILNEINVMIQKGKDKYNKLVDCIYEGVFLFHLEKLQYVNKGALEFLNIKDKKDIINLDLDKFMEEYIKQKEIIRDKENCISKINSENENSEIFLIYVDDYTQILYIHDISELNENKKLREELEEYLKVDEIKKKFFANISHELKTPINVIFSALQVNDLHIKDKNMLGIDKNFKRIRQNCMRLIRTINNFIDANKISEGYVVPNLQVHNIVEIIEDTANMCDKYIKLVHNTLVFDSEEEEIYVLCDKEMIMTIILNILSNSVKYAIDGGWIKIYIEVTGRESINIRIKNNGLKIDEKTVPYIFDKFTKLNKAFNRLREGSGLGLFLTKGLVELQNGKIRLTSSKEGNEFIIELPKIDKTQDIIYETLDDKLQINKLEEKVDIEFSDIYIE